MGFSAGTLDLSILGVSDSAVASIDKTVKSLNSFSRAINKINNSNFYSAGVHLEYIFSKIARATNSINSTNLNNLADATKSLSGISKIGNLGKIDFEKVSAGFAKLSVSIEPFLEKVKGAETSLVALNGVLSKSSKTQIANALNGDGKSKDKSSLWSAVKWTTVLYTARRLGSVVANIVQKGSDYTETLNLWQVAMRNNLDMADEFVNKMNKAYGISSKTLMNAQATFKNMIGSLGQISDSTAYKLSEALVQMSADFASLYNVNIESAFTKMQSMLAGQVRPIRSAGLDMTETTLYQYYQALGGTKSMRQLNRTEKQLLSILAVYKQMGSAGALGDMTKTLNQFANQSRMMTEYWSELKSWTGLILKDFLDQKNVLVYINAVLIAITDVIKAIAKSKGLGEENFIDGMFESTEATNEEIDKLQGKLLDFDKFRSLDQGANNVLGIDTELLEALSGYSSLIDGAQNKAQKLADELKRASGLFNEEGVFQPERWDEIAESIERVGNAILIAFGGITIASGVSNLIPILSKIPTVIKDVQISFGLLTAANNSGKTIEAIAAGFTNVSKSSVGLANALKFLRGPVGIILTLLVTLYATNEEFRDTINEIFGVLFDIVGQILTPLMSLLGSLGNILGWIIDKILAPVIGGVIYNGLMPILFVVEAIVKAVSSLFYLLDALIHWDWDSLGSKLNNLWTDWATGDYISKFSTATPYAQGGLPDKGTVFVAGEAGAEMVYNMPNGQSGVANIRQIEQAMFNALQRHSANGNEPIVIQAYLDGEKVYENTTTRAKARGNVWAKA